jgi:hypothetical protein
MIGLSAAIVLFFGLVTPAAANPEAIATLRNAAAKFCVDGGGEVTAWARSLNARVVEKRPFRHPINVMGWRGVLRLLDGGEIRYRAFEQKGRMVRLSLEYHARLGKALRPVLTTTVGQSCIVIGGRGLRYDAKGRPERLNHYGEGFAKVRRSEALNPPVPPGRDPGGVTVALVDAGLNYTLPKFARRMARDANGKPLGYDYWDMDDRPFDSNPVRSPFAPQRHGTEIASIILREGPSSVRLLPYRYPRPDMKRMADLVEAADRNGSVIVSVPMGSNRMTDWLAFANAARARPHMLFVISAGNNGRDIDQTPVYPAAFGLENGIVVSSSEESGWRAGGSNWGKKSVDLMIPAENVPVTRFDGRAGRASGSSHAVARVVALAARLRKRNPDWRAPELKAAIIERATAAMQPSVSRYGWIPDPPPKAK